MIRKVITLISTHISFIVEVMGVSVITVGVSLLYLPAGLIVCGGLLLVMSFGAGRAEE